MKQNFVACIERQGNKNGIAEILTSHRTPPESCCGKRAGSTRFIIVCERYEGIDERIRLSMRR